MLQNELSIAFALLSVAGLSACVSSGGDSQPPAPRPAVVAPGTDEPGPLSFPDGPGLTAAQESERNSFARSTEFQEQWSLSRIGADYAYARGYTGRGVTVAIIDTGVDPNHSAIAGKLHADSGVASANCPGGNCTFSAIRDAASHGTLVGGVIAAAKLGQAMHGVAYEAELLALGIQLGRAQPVYRPVDLSNPRSFQGLDEQGQGLYRRIGRSTRIINHSFGYEGLVTDYTAAQYRAAFGRIVDSLLQSSIPDPDKAIMVWAAGNSNGRRDVQGNLADASSPNLTAATPHYFPALRGHFITVVAIAADGGIAHYSNRCGVAADYCIAAPGSNVGGPLAGTSGGYQQASGTSLAAPQVAGALALMEQAFRGQLGSTEMVSRLFAAADKSDIYADRETYGQGLLDVEKATRPIGMARAALGASLAGPATAVQGTTIAAGPGWGDALQRGLSGRELAVFDTLNAPFFIPMSALQAPWALDGGLRMDMRFAGFLERGSRAAVEPAAHIGGWTLSSAPGLAGAFHPDGSGQQLLNRAAGFRNEWIALGTRGLGLARNLLPAGRSPHLRLGFFVQNAAATRGERLAAPGRARGAFLNFGMNSGEQRISAELGLLRESERLLGAGASGAYGRLAGNTWFTRLVAQRALGGGLVLLASAQGGYTSAEAKNGLLQRARRVLSGAYSAAIDWHSALSGLERRFWIEVSQPLRNESGALVLDYPAGRTRGGEVVRKTAFLDAEPSGRQLDIALGFEAALRPAAGQASAWRIRAEAWRSLQPGHRASARPENALFLALHRSF